MIDLVLMASGASRRFGLNKLLMEVKGKPIYAYGLETYAPIGQIDRKVVVSQNEEILEAGRKLGYMAVFNNDSSEGISASVKHGLRALGFEEGRDYSDEASGVIFAVCDQPLLTSETVIRLIDFFKGNDKGMACLQFKDRGTSPRIFTYRYIRELLAIEGDLGGRQVLRRHKDDIAYMSVDNEQEVFDVDTLEDFHALWDILK